MAQIRPRSSSPQQLPPDKKPRLDSESATNGTTGVVPPTIKNSRRKHKQPPFPEPCSSDDVVWKDVVALLGQNAVDAAIQQSTDLASPVSFGDEVQLLVSELSSNGESLSLLPSPHPPWAVLVPFALPGETIRARIHRNARLHSFADLLEIVIPNDAMRDMDRVKCKYFGKCAGCQYQMLSYETQLQLKQNVVTKAFRNFSGLASDLVPSPRATIASPQTYSYRTKITPHFEAPAESRTRGRRSKGKPGKVGSAEGQSEDFAIGFNEMGRRRVLDIEECPIATPILNEALGPARRQVQENRLTYKRGATLLLRDSLKTSEDGSGSEEHICVTDHKAIVRERVGSTIFEFGASTFFQNNNSVLLPLTTYVRDAIISPSVPRPPPTHLVDTYCGSGLFAITLAPHFAHVAGIEISEESIRYARHNASLNQLPEDKCVFHAGKAEAIFDSVQDFPPETTVVVIDPPRKGCDIAFINQLLTFRPHLVVYVSCNVHTQARDVGIIVSKTANDGEGRRYELESLSGIDLFPQTAHVESVAVLRLF